MTPAFVANDFATCKGISRYSWEFVDDNNKYYETFKKLGDWLDNPNTDIANVQTKSKCNRNPMHVDILLKYHATNALNNVDLPKYLKSIYTNDTANVKVDLNIDSYCEMLTNENLLHTERAIHKIIQRNNIGFEFSRVFAPISIEDGNLDMWGLTTCTSMNGLPLIRAFSKDILGNSNFAAHLLAYGLAVASFGDIMNISTGNEILASIDGNRTGKKISDKLSFTSQNPYYKYTCKRQKKAGSWQPYNIRKQYPWIYEVDVSVGANTMEFRMLRGVLASLHALDPSEPEYKYKVKEILDGVIFAGIEYGEPFESYEWRAQIIVRLIYVWIYYDYLDEFPSIDTLFAPVPGYTVCVDGESMSTDKDFYKLINSLLLTSQGMYNVVQTHFPQYACKFNNIGGAANTNYILNVINLLILLQIPTLPAQVMAFLFITLISQVTRSGSTEDMQKMQRAWKVIRNVYWTDARRDSVIAKFEELYYQDFKDLELGDMDNRCNIKVSKIPGISLVPMLMSVKSILNRIDLNRKIIDGNVLITYRDMATIVDNPYSIENAKLMTRLNDLRMRTNVRVSDVASIVNFLRNEVKMTTLHMREITKGCLKQRTSPDNKVYGKLLDWTGIPGLEKPVDSCFSDYVKEGLELYKQRFARVYYRGSVELKLLVSSNNETYKNILGVMSLVNASHRYSCSISNYLSSNVLWFLDKNRSKFGGDYYKMYGFSDLAIDQLRYYIQLTDSRIISHVYADRGSEFAKGVKLLDSMLREASMLAFTYRQVDKHVAIPLIMLFGKDLSFENCQSTRLAFSDANVLQQKCKNKELANAVSNIYTQSLFAFPSCEQLELKPFKTSPYIVVRSAIITTFNSSMCAYMSTYLLKNWRTNVSNVQFTDIPEDNIKGLFHDTYELAKELSPTM